METSIGRVIGLKRNDISAWLATNPAAGSTKGFVGNPGMGNLGRGFEVTTVGGNITAITRPMPNVNVVLISNGNGGYFIHTAHPQY